MKINLLKTENGFSPLYSTDKNKFNELPNGFEFISELVMEGNLMLHKETMAVFITGFNLCPFGFSVIQNYINFMLIRMRYFKVVKVDGEEIRVPLEINYVKSDPKIIETIIEKTKELILKDSKISLEKLENLIINNS